MVRRDGHVGDEQQQKGRRHGPLAKIFAFAVREKGCQRNQSGKVVRPLRSTLHLGPKVLRTGRVILFFFFSEATRESQIARGSRGGCAF